MVCERCIRVVREELQKFGLDVRTVELGEVEVVQSPRSNDINSIKKILEQNGFELIEDKNAKTIEAVKTAIIQLVHHNHDTEPMKLKYSEYITQKIGKDLKDFSRVGEAEWQWADIHQCLDSTLNIVWNELKYKCTVTKQYAAGLPQIRCLPSQLNQVFMNLLLNAAQAIPDKGEITIGTLPAGEDAIQIVIHDSGTGIPAENLQRIFDPFFTTKPIGKGTGLGLSIVWGIVGRHHGKIEASSAVGAGTTFTLTLPVSQSEETPP